MASKLVLNNKELTEEFFDETRLLGIMAPMKDYQFCWQLNTLMNMDLRSNPEIEIQLIRKKRTYYFSIYSYYENNSALCHFIYKNHIDGEFLLPEFKHLDFLWLMKGDIVSNETIDQVMAAIKLISGVQLVLDLAPEKIINKENLVF
jgi:hypothetical protein